MSDLLERLNNESPIEFKRRTIESLEWFRSRIKNIRLESDTFYRQSNLKKTREYLEGRMYLYGYNAKWQDKLPYWDSFPCTIVLDTYQEGFLGLNLHYLPPKLRAIFLDRLFTYVGGEESEDDPGGRRTEKFRVYYDIIKATPKLNFGVPCLKKYLYSQLVTPALEIEPKYWDIVSMLPLASFNKQPTMEVYRKSREMING